MGILNAKGFADAIGPALMMIGAMGKPQMQANILANLQAQAERRRQQNQYQGLLSSFAQPQGGSFPEFSARTNPPIVSRGILSGPESGMGLSEPEPRVKPPVKSINGPPLHRAHASGTEGGGDATYLPPGQSAVTGRGILEAPETAPPPGMSGGSVGILSPELAGQSSMFTPRQIEMLEALPPEIGMRIMAERTFAQPAAPEIIEDAAGFKRYATGPQAGQRVFPDVEGKPEKPDMRQDAAGHWRYTTGPQAGQRVFPGIERGADTKRTAVNVRLPDGTITPGRKTETGELEFLDRSGAYRPVPFGSSMAGVQLSGTEADADKVRARKFREYEDAASNFMQYGTGLVNAIDTGTPLFGTTGALARFTNSLRAQAEQIGRAFDGEKEAANIAQRMQPGSQTWDRLRQVVGDRADVLGTGIALAYMRAKMLDPTGRVSDADLENSIKSLGFDTNDPSIIRRRIINEMNFLNRSYQSRAQREQIGNTQRFNIPARKQEEKRKRLKDKYGLE